MALPFSGTLYINGRHTNYSKGIFIEKVGAPSPNDGIGQAAWDSANTGTYPLKLKELSYLHAEGYPAGEMKHGPLALIEDGIPVVVLAPRDKYYKKTISNMQEVIARGAKVLLITNKNKEEIVSENIWEKIEVENTTDDLLPFLITIPLQKLAYYSALKKGYDIDKPRNLAKSVTVE